MNIQKAIIILFTLIIFTGCTKTQTPQPTPQATKQPNSSTISFYVTKTTQSSPNASSFGCEDTLLKVEKEIINSVQPPVKSAVTELLNAKDGYTDANIQYNVFYQSNLELDEITESQETISVYITGELKLGGVCDNPRVKEQLTKTIEEYVKGKKINILINNIPVDEYLSLI